MVPVSLLDAVAATLQKPFQLLPFAVSNTWELHGINRISVGIDMFSHLFLFFLSLAACSIRSFSSVCHFSSASCITSQTTDQYSCICTALPQHLSHRGWRCMLRHPTEGWHDFDDVGTTLSLLFCKLSWLMKDITFSASVLCCFLSDPTACCLMNWMKNMPMETLIQASLNLVKPYQQRFWPIVSKYPNSPEK